MEAASYAFWAGWAAVGLGFELYAVKNEKRNGALPLTRVVRDRIVRRAWPLKFLMLGFLAWLVVHFVEPLSW